AGAALVAILALAGVNVATNTLGLERLPIWVGLILAVVVFTLVAYWYLRRCACTTRASIEGALTLAIVLIVLAPYLVGKIRADESAVPTSEQVASELDVAIVGDGRRHAHPPPLPRNPLLDEFDVRYSVGFARGEEVRWTLVGEADVEKALETVADGDAAPVVDEVFSPRQGADSVLLLLPDGTPPVSDPAALPEVDDGSTKVEVARWRKIAAAAAPPATPAFALLQTTDPARTSGWRKLASPGGGVSAQALGSRTVADAAVRLAVAAVTSQADAALAMTYRPILLFDRAEPVPWPLSVNALIAEGRITLCHDQGVAKTKCEEEPLKRAGDLVNGGTHLHIRTKDSEELQRLAKRELEAHERTVAAATAAEANGLLPAGTPPAAATETLSPGEGPAPGAGSAIYVHPVSIERDERDLLYLDYWWYLPDNPVGVGGGALCGAGFVIPGVTCQNHQSDWEGITVVLEREIGDDGSEQAKPVAVHYAEHSSVVRYGWTLLRDRW
ncbi:MAG TPA: hypothetical protein VHH14_04685, partial [Solirubrobacterales bacterium]|nr:hypothetical protein [Solirubrobacterales bacterium]